MSTTHPRLPAFATFGCSARLQRRLAMLVLATIFLSTLFTIADVHAAAWNPGHGHVYRDAIPMAHAHPWGAPARTAALACAARSASADVIFTPSAEALAGASIAAPVLVGESFAPCAPALSRRLARAADDTAFVGAISSVPTRPPRG